MAILESDVDVAGQIATKIAGSLDGANNSSGAILSDTQTTVAGNTNAQAAIQAILAAQNKIIQAVGQAATNLQIVASEFEAADQTIRQFISASSLPSPQSGAQK
ncbi:TIGR04197 family type VII secretion effector [Enterococcus faecalis]